MNFELLSSLARSRGDELLRAATVRRLLVRARSAEPAPRLRLARAVRSMGYFALRVGDTLAGSR